MTVPGNLSSPLLATAADSAAAAANITKSVRFNDNDSAHLTRTPSSAGNRRTWTWAAWVKRANLGGYQSLFADQVVGGTNGAALFFTLDNSIRFEEYTGGGFQWALQTTQLFRDCSAWIHIVAVLNTTASTANERVRLYINGSEVTETSTRTNPSQNFEGSLNRARITDIASYGSFDTSYFDGYLADIYFIDGSALDPTSFGAFDSNGVWQAAAYSGTYGTNGFHLLDFANESTIGHDSSGNNNDFTAYNLVSVAGDPSYLTETTLSGSIYSGAGGKEKIFDGTTATAGPSQGSSITFTPSPSITISSSLRIRANVSNVNGDAVLQINGSNYQTSNLSFPASGNIANAASTWVTIPSPPSTLTSLRFGWESHWIAVSGIEVDGVELLSDPGAMDILFDSPVNGDQSDTGNGGELSGCYATWNPLGPGGSSTYGTFSNGNLDVSLPASGKSVFQTIFPQSGKWYVEINFVSGGGAGGGLRMGVINENNINADLGSTANSWAYLADGRVYHSGSAPSYGVSSAPGDLLMMCLDIDAGKVWYGKNGSWMASGNPAAGSNPSQTFTAGQKMSFSVQSGSGTAQVVNANWGQREWLYNAPSGFKAVCTTNLPTPTIADGSDHFQATLWSGTGSSRSITTTGMGPDFVWYKQRNSSSYGHDLFDSVRGPNNILNSNNNLAQYTEANRLTAFNADGFSLGNSAPTNGSSGTYVGWAWNAGANSNKTYTVKVVSDSGNKYRFDDFGTSAVTLDLAEGSTYVFDQSDSSNSGHPLRFSTTSDGTHGSGSEYTTGVTTTGTPGSSGAKTTIVVAASAPTLYYYCSAHSGMGGQANTNSTAGASNFDGSIQARVKANPTAGFSIVTYTGNGTDNATFGHGLNAAPEVIIVKRRDSADDWFVYTLPTANNILKLNATDAATGSSHFRTMSSSTFQLSGNADVNANNGTFVAYCISPVAGFSAVGSYTGNGSASDGPFIQTSFKVAFLITKRTNSSTSGDWNVVDTTRGTYNPVGPYLYANKSNAEGDATIYDLLSNGFKIRESGAGTNNNGSTYIYFAFASNPFSSNGGLAR